MKGHFVENIGMPVTFYEAGANTFPKIIVYYFPDKVRRFTGGVSQ